MGRLVVLLTTPRLPAGLLTASAWRTIDAADVVAAASPDLPLVRALMAEGVPVEVLGKVSQADLVARADDATLVWVAGDDDDELTQALAADVVRRAESPAAAGGSGGPDIEVMVGSFDPPGSRLLDLVEVMDRLRAECPWDQKQTHESLVRYLVEEAYETIEAIESGDRTHLREELGDLVLQVVFHARIAAEHADEPFTIDDVAADIVDKLVRRHPHVFGDVSVAGSDEVEANWDAIKAHEKSRTSAMEGIPAGLPALSLAAKVVERALKEGRVSVPVESETAYTEETLAEVLFALAAAASAAGLDPEQALRRRTFTEMEHVRALEQRALSDEESTRR